MNVNHVQNTILICILLFINTVNANSQVTARNWLNKAKTAVEEHDFNCTAYADSALEIALEQKDSSLLPEIYFVKGKAAMATDFWPNATSYFDNALEYYNALGMECKSLEMRAWKARAICDMEPQKSILELKGLINLKSRCGEINSGMLEWYLAYPYQELGKTDSARLYLQEALVQAELNETSLTPDILESLGGNCVAAGDHTKALEFYQKAAEGFGMSKRNYRKARSYLSISKIYGAIRSDSLALLYTNSAINTLDANVGGMDLQIGLYTERGNIFFSQGNGDESVRNYKKAIEAFEESGRTYAEISGVTLAELGLVYLNLGQFRQASEVLSAALVKKKKTGNLESTRSLIGNLSSAYAQMGELDSARKYCLELLQIVQTAPNMTNELEQVYDMLSYISQWDNDLNAALRYSRRKCDVADSLCEIDATKRVEMSLLDGTHSSNLMVQEIEKLESEVLDTRNDLQINKNLQKAYLLALVLVLVGVCVLWVQLRKRMNITRSLQTNQVKNLEQQLAYKKRDLVSYSLKSLNNQEVLEHVSDSLEDVKRELIMETPKVNRLLSQLKLHINKKDGWESFKFHFEQINPKFFEFLEQKFPGLTQNERRLMALVKMKFDNAEIAKLQNVQVDSIRKAKTRLRTKLGIENDDELLYVLNEDKSELA